MGIRRKIALWIDPSIEDDIESLENARDHSRGIARDWAKIVDRLRLGHRNIIALKTPNCANIGKKMSRIAEEALK